MTLQELEPKLLVLKGSSMEIMEWRDSSQGWEHWQQQSWKFLFGVNPPWNSPLTLPHSPQIPGLGYLRQTTNRREHNPTHQHIIELKLY